MRTILATLLALFALPIFLATSEAQEVREAVRTGSYWEAYRAVLVKAVCDSAGTVKSAELLHSFASPAESDSILALVSGMKFDPKNWIGQIRRWKYKQAPTDGDLHFIVPFMNHGGESTPVPGTASRADLELAGLSDWLAIWEELLPEWPFEKWAVSWTNSMYELPPDYEVDDAELLAFNLVSISPDGVWRLHPFYDVEFGEDGQSSGLGADGGFFLYRSSVPNRAWQLVTGTSFSYSSAEWIDEDHFVLTGLGEASLGYKGKSVSYRRPTLIFGHADSRDLIGLSGPPISIQDVATMRMRLKEFQEKRYPKIRVPTRP